MIATYQDMVSNPTFENLIKNVISVITKLGELVNSIGLAKIVFIAFSAIMYKLGSLVLPIVTKQLIAFGTSFLLITDNIAMFPSMIKNISFALMSGGGLTGALTAAETALLSFGSMLGGLAIAAAVVGITYAVMNYKTAAEKAKESIEEFADAEREHKQTSEDLSAQLDENIAKYEELAKVKSLGNISDKQEEEMANLATTNELLKKQIAYEDTLARIAKNSKQEAAKKALEDAMFDTGIEDNARNNAITGKAGMSSNTRKVNIENMGAEVKATAEEYAELIAEAYQKGDEKAVERLKAEAKAYQGKVAEFDYSGYVESLDKTSEEYKNLMGNTEDVNYGTTMLEIVLGSAGLSMEEYALATDEATVASEELASATEKLDTMSTIFAIATDGMNTLKSAQNELSESNSLSWGTIQGLITAYPALKNKLYGYMQGVVSNTEMVDLLTKAYSDQETTMEDNLNSSKDYYNTMILGNSEMYQKFLNDYNVDLTNFTNLNELKTYLQQQMTIDGTQEEADRVNNLAESYNIDLSNFGSVIEKKIEMQRQLTLLIDQERAKQATKLSEIAAKTGAYVPAGYAKDSAQSVAYKDALKELGAVGVDQSVYDSIINNVKNLAGGISAKSLSEIDTTDAGGSSSSASAIGAQDMATAFIKAANAMREVLSLQEKGINKQIDQASKAEDYAKQIELENQLLVNQKLQVLEILNANEKIHEEADRLRSNSKYSEASKGWFDMNGEATSTYINLLESYAGKTDKVSKAQYEAITTLYDSLYKLKNGWYDNVDAIDTLNSSMLDVVQNIQNIKEKQLTAVNDAQDVMMDYQKAHYDKLKKEEEDRHDDVISNIDKEIDALERKYDLEDYNKDIAKQDKAILEKQAELNALALDNSSEAMAKKAALQKEIDELMLAKDESVEEQKRENAKNTLEDLKDAEDKKYKDTTDRLEEESSDIELFNKTRLELENSTTEEIMKKYEELGETISGMYDSATEKAKLFAAVSSGKTVVDDEDSAYNSSGSSKPNYILVNSKGVSNAKEGDIVVTGSGLWQKNADGVASTYIGGLPNVDGGKTSDYSKVVEAYNQLKAYKNGGLVDSTGIVQLDGTKSNPEYVLNSADFASLLKVMDMTKMIIPGIDASSSSSSGSYGSANIYPEVNIYSVANENVNSLVDKVKAEVWNDFDKKLNLAGIKYKRL